MEIEITFGDVLRATLARLGLLRWYFALIWCVGIVHAIRRANVLLGCFMVAIVLLIVGAIYRSHSKIDAVHRRVETRVDGDGVHLRTGGSSSIIAFVDLARVRWTKHVVYLFLATGAVAAVLTRGLDEESRQTLQQATLTRTESSASVMKGSVLRVLAAWAVLAVVFAVVWAVAVRGR